MSNAHISAMTKRLCGHIDMYSFSSKGRSGRSSDSLYATATVCGECRARLGGLIANPGVGFFPLALPALAGRENAVRWAKDIRLKLLRKLGPVMVQLKKSQDPLAAAPLAAYEMLFKIPTALFWIDTRDFPFDSTSYQPRKLLLHRRPLHRQRPLHPFFCSVHHPEEVSNAG